MRPRRSRSAPLPRSAFAGFRFPPDVIVVAVRWHLRFGLSYRDVQELLTERGIEVDHVTVYRWVQRFTPLLATPPGLAGIVSETAGRWTRPMSRSPGSGATSAAPRPVRPGRRRVRLPAARHQGGPTLLRASGRYDQVTPVEVVTDHAPAYLGVLEGADASSLASNRPVRQQPMRVNIAVVARDRNPQHREERRQDPWMGPTHRSA